MIVNDAMREMLAARGTVNRGLRNAPPVEAIDPGNVSDQAKYVTGTTLPVGAGYTNKK